MNYRLIFPETAHAAATVSPAAKPLPRPNRRRTTANPPRSSRAGVFFNTATNHPGPDLLLYAIFPVRLDPRFGTWAADQTWEGRYGVPALAVPGSGEILLLTRKTLEAAGGFDSLLTGATAALLDLTNRLNTANLRRVEIPRKFVSFDPALSSPAPTQASPDSQGTRSEIETRYLRLKILLFGLTGHANLSTESRRTAFRAASLWTRRSRPWNELQHLYDC